MPDSSKRVLYIEDDPSVITAIGDALVEAGYTVKAVTNGSEALQAAIEFQPQVIITGILMPGANGIDVIEQLSADRATAHIPVIVLSAIQDEKIMAKALAAGAVAYLPSDQTTVAELLEAVAEVQHANKQIEVTFVHTVSPELRELFRKRKAREAQDPKNPDS